MSLGPRKNIYDMCWYILMYKNVVMLLMNIDLLLVLRSSAFDLIHHILLGGISSSYYGDAFKTRHDCEFCFVIIFAITVNHSFINI